MGKTRMIKENGADGWNAKQRMFVEEISRSNITTQSATVLGSPVRLTEMNDLQKNAKCGTGAAGARWTGNGVRGNT